MRMFLCLATALSLSAFLFNFVNSWFGEETSVLRLGRSLVFETRRAEAMKARADMVARSLAIKREIVTQLIGRSLKLREAIDQFHKANEMIENMDRNLVAPYRLPTDSEGVGRQVLAWAYHELESYPSAKTQRLLTDLESQYQTLFGRPSEMDMSLEIPPPANGRGSV